MSTKQTIVFVADFFVNDVTGGAELTTQALIESAPEDFRVLQIYARDVTKKTIEEGKDFYWIFTNFSSINFNLIQDICNNLDFSVIEYDYKFCKYRSIDKHLEEEKKECDCHEQLIGKLISTFYLNAKSLWFMSEKQEQIYLERFPFLEKVETTVLSSVFDEQFFIDIKNLNSEEHDRSGWLVLESASWVKGTKESEAYCIENNLDYKKISGLSKIEFLREMRKSEGIVYLPPGGDTCPRMIIEAKLLGCQLILNDNVQHRDEIWFNTEDEVDTLSYLYAARERFWNGISFSSSWQPKISGYTTVYNCIEHQYPWEKCIESMLGFCDEVVVVDSGSEDGTWERLLEIKNSDSRIVAIQNKIDWDHPRFAYHSDGMQKSFARSNCTGDFCWQMDSDEFVIPRDFEKIKNFAKRFPKMAELIALPVIEFWGSYEKIRVDVNPWKWRISRNKEYISHGIPKELQRFDDNGDMYTAHGSDTCDYIHKETSDRIPFVAFYSEEVEVERRKSLLGDKDSLEKYSNWIQSAIDNIPCVYHMSWHDLERKINLYKKYWSKFWQSQYNEKIEDTAESNMFFDKPWSEVSNEEIKDLAKKLGEEMGGWIFHQKIDWQAKTPYVKANHRAKEFLEN